ncbi:MAG: Skp family chaperone for outer membrane protein [Paraglaciecola sp.]|jgi:Skp family chaperone for outer membrane proteins
MKLTLIIALMVSLTACQSVYYSAWEKVGVEKRDILVDRVEDAKESQEEAQQQFSSALDQFSQLINFKGGDLQDVYQQLKGEYEASDGSASRVSRRIDKVEAVAEALFDEWQEELEKYSSNTLRRDSHNKLKDTQRRYKSLLKAMRKAESTMAPVLSALQDNVLYLKHNLNASAVGALQGEFKGIEQEIERLIKEMKTAISQSNDFISSMKS